MDAADQPTLDPLCAATRPRSITPSNNECRGLVDGLNAELLRARSFVRGLTATVSALQEAIALSREHIKSSRDLIQSPVIGGGCFLGDAQHPDHLTTREKQVLKLVARGATNKAIGHELGISMKTVEFHRSNAVRKLGLDNRAEIVKFVTTHGWI